MVLSSFSASERNELAREPRDYWCRGMSTVDLTLSGQGAWGERTSSVHDWPAWKVDILPDIPYVAWQRSLCVDRLLTHPYQQLEADIDNVMDCIRHFLLRSISRVVGKM